MRKWIQRLTVRQIVVSLTVAVCLLIWGGLTAFSVHLKNGQKDQTVAARWSSEDDVAQISCFFTESTEIDNNKIMTFKQKIKDALQEASITSPDEKVRLWADAYSSQGSVKLLNGKTSLEVNAVGAGGDFFLFHPVQLLDGAYFSGSDLMQDKILIDEDTAWQLFGSNDVTGMAVSIGGVPHYVSGVIRREDGRLHRAAGLDKTLVYLSNESLEAYGTTQGINCYEVVMPSPVSGFASKKIKETFGIDENGMWVVENSARYGFGPLFTVISEFGVRSMNARAIRYPYWENVARGYEDILAVLLVLQILFLLIPAVTVIVTLIVLWKRRTFTFRDVWHNLIKGKDTIVEKVRREKNKWKDF